MCACGDASLIAGSELTVDPPEIDFGRVPTGETRSAELRLENHSESRVLPIERLALAAASGEGFSLRDIPSAILPGGEATVIVRYTAADDEPDFAHVEIEPGDVEGAILRVPLRSARTVARIGVEPAALDLRGIVAGTEASRAVRITSRGEATLMVSRVFLRREGSCAMGGDSSHACGHASESPVQLTALRGFRVSAERLPSLPDLLPRAHTEATVTYAPDTDDRGDVELVFQSNDREHPVTVIPLRGRPQDLPPIAVASLDGTPQSVIEPGTRIALDGAASFDPEGTAIAFEWRFLVRPEGSRARFEDPGAPRTAFWIDLPGRYVAHLEVRDRSGLTSTNEARLEVEATAGTHVRVVLEWSRDEIDLDLHLLQPGVAAGSVGDCFSENRTPDWNPLGSGGDPVFTATTSLESIAIADPAPGVYALLVRAMPSPAVGPANATLTVYLNDVEAAIFDAPFPAGTEHWDVATLSWPSGRLTPLSSTARNP